MVTQDTTSSERRDEYLFDRAKTRSLANDHEKKKEQGRKKKTKKKRVLLGPVLRTQENNTSPKCPKKIAS